MVAYESTNALNNMLPAVKKAHEEAEKVEDRKRQKTEGLKAF